MSTAAMPNRMPGVPFANNPTVVNAADALMNKMLDFFM